MKQTLCARFTDAELKHIRAAGGGPNAYLRRLVQEDMNKGEADALLALSFNELCDTQADQLEQFKAFQSRFIAELASVLELAKSQHEVIEQSFDALGALTEIADANNTLLESIERQSKKAAVSVHGRGERC